MDTKLGRAPIFYSLAQVRFNPIGQMKDFEPMLQDKLRHLGYPDNREESLPALDFHSLQKAQPEVKFHQNTRWSYSNFDKTEGYYLNNNALTFHTTSYTSHEEFFEKLIRGLNLVNEVIGLSFIDRIGLRYLNAILPEAEKELTDYLSPSLLGFASIFDENLKQNVTEGMLSTSSGTLVARLYTVSDALVLPPDLMPLHLELHPRFSTPRGKTSTLDIDHFFDKRINFDTKIIKDTLIDLHKMIKVTFKASVTSYAFNVWR